MENAACRLYPPVSASISNTSPIQNRFGISFDINVLGFISRVSIPPAVVIAILYPPILSIVNGHAVNRLTILIRSALLSCPYSLANDPPYIRYDL